MKYLTRGVSFYSADSKEIGQEMKLGVFYDMIESILISSFKESVSTIFCGSFCFIYRHKKYHFPFTKIVEKFNELLKKWTINDKLLLVIDSLIRGKKYA